MKQLDIPAKDMHLFLICNRANYWGWKQSFYDFKSKLLHEKGREDGYDLQIIEKECYACEGTGMFRCNWKLPETCWHCIGDGICHTKRIVLKRWILNGEVFHEPVGTWNNEYSFKNTITGRIKHDPIPDVHPTFAYLQLLYKYDKDKFFAVVKAIGQAQKTKARYKWQRSFRKCRNMLEGLAKFFGLEKKQQWIESDDLPF